MNMRFGRDGISGVQRVARAAMASAIVFAVTFFARVPIPFLSGAYVNLGDGAVYLCCLLFGRFPAIFAGSVGSALADLSAGAAAYIPATAVIKGLMGFISSLLLTRVSQARVFLVSVVCGGVMAFGYFAYEFAVFGLPYALSALPFNLLQWAGTAAVSFAVYPCYLRLRRVIPGINKSIN